MAKFKERYTGKIVEIDDNKYMLVNLYKKMIRKWEFIDDNNKEKAKVVKAPEEVEDLENMSVSELKQVASEKGIKVNASLKKAEIVELLK